LRETLKPSRRKSRNLKPAAAPGDSEREREREGEGEGERERESIRTGVRVKTLRDPFRRCPFFAYKKIEDLSFDLFLSWKISVFL